MQAGTGTFMICFGMMMFQSCPHDKSVAIFQASHGMCLACCWRCGPPCTDDIRVVLCTVAFLRLIWTNSMLTAVYVQTVQLACLLL